MSCGISLIGLLRHFDSVHGAEEEEEAGRRRSRRRRDGGADEASSHQAAGVLMGRAATLRGGGEEKTSREGRGSERGKEKEGADLPLPLTQAPGNFLIDFQGYAPDLFLRRGRQTREPVDIFQAIFPKFTSGRVPPRPPPPLLSLERRKEVTFTPSTSPIKKKRSKRKPVFPDRMLRTPLTTSIPGYH